MSLRFFVLWLVIIGFLVASLTVGQSPLFFEKALAAAPTAPSNLTATVVSSSQINLLWQDNSTNETGFEVESSIYASTGYAKIADLPANQTSYQNTGLGEASTRYYRVRAVNGDGPSSFSNIANAKTWLNAPTNLQAFQYSTTQVNLTWQDNSAKEWYYVMDRSTTGQSGPWTNIATLSTNATSYSNTGLETNNNYCYRVYPYGSGTPYSNIACVTVIAPVWAGSAFGMGDAFKVAISGNYAYVTSNIGLQIVDITNLSNPLILGTLELQSAYGVAIGETGMVFVSDGYTVKVVDVANKFAPQIIGSVQLPDYVYGLSYANATLYAADSEAGLVIINPLPATAPTITRTIDTPGQANAVAVVENTAVIADGTAGLAVINLNSSVVTSLATAGSALDVKLKDNLAYVAASSAGLLSIDVSDSAHPRLISTTRVRDLAVGLTISGNYVYLADFSYGYSDHGMHIYDISAQTPDEKSFTRTSGRTRGGVAAEGAKAVFAGGWTGITMIDAQNVNAPLVKFILPQTTRTADVETSGNYLYVLNQNSVQSNMYIFDLSNPASPRHTGSFKLESPFAIVVEGSYAYVGDSQTVKIINISDPANPVLAGTYTSPDYIYGVTKSGNFLYIANDKAGLTIINVSLPSSPSFIRTIDTPGQANSVAISGSYAYVAAGDAGLQVVSLITNTVVGSLALADVAWDVRVKESFAYVAAGRAGLAVVDISSPTPKLVKNVPAKDLARGVALYNNWAIVASFSYGTSTNGLQVFDISRPADTHELSFHINPGLKVAQVAVSSHYAYVTDDKILISILDLNGPSAEPTLTKSADKTSVRSGEEITYSLTAANPTAASFTALSLTDPVPTGASYVAGSAILNGTPVTDAPDGDAYTFLNGVPTWSISSLLPAGQSGSTVSASFRVKVN